ncbi:MAG: S-layer homology domain-containing protein [Clostridiales Family XIII bacterium]|jgi:hypothetical protein|nr:S-layer homology domain-containing protein [Clostridiales Family XIII bacterium]
MKSRNPAMRLAAAFTAAALALSGAFLYQSGDTAGAATNFVDTVGHWADDEIRAAVDYGYINGYSDGYFRPDSYVKRSEFVKAVNSAMGYSDLGNIAFSDVPYYEWYYDEIRKAAAAGYISGYGTWFAPENPITREEVAVALYRISPGTASTKAPKGVKDAGSISDWALSAVNSSYTKGYLGGYPDGNFYPKQNLTRAETVKIVNKVIGIDKESRAITEMELLDYTDKQAVVEFVSSSAGTLYWVALKTDATIPTATQVSQGKDGRGESPVQKGSVKLTASEPVSVTIQNLSPSEPYRICAMGKISNTKLSNVRNLSFTTVEEASIGQGWLSGFNVGSVTQDSAVLNARSSEKGTLYWVIIKSSSSGRPSQANITAGNDRDGEKGAASGSTPVSRNADNAIEVTGLSPGTSYYAYGYVSKSSTEYSTVVSSSFSTSGINTPGISSLTASFNDRNELEISVRLNAAGTFYWIAVEESGSASRPTAEKLKSGTANSGQVVADSGSVSIASANISNTVITKAALSAADKLKPDTKYRIYGCVEGASTKTLSSVSNTGIIEKTISAGGLTALTVTAMNQSNARTALGGFSFKTDGYAYSGATVPNGTNRLVIRPVAGSSVDISVEGRITASNTERIVDWTAEAGTADTITVETSEAGKNKKTYNIAITENRAAVSSVYVSGADPDPQPDGQGNYAVTVPANYTDVNVALTFTSELAATMKAPDGPMISIKSGERKNFALAGDETALQIDMKGPAGGDTKTYQLKITRLPDSSTSPSAMLP